MKEGTQRKLNNLIKDRDDLDITIRKFQSRLTQIEMEIRKIRRDDFNARLNEMSLKEGSTFALFAKSLDYHCEMIKLIKIEYIPSGGAGRIRCIAASYGVNDGRYSFRSSMESISLRDFAELCNANTAYKISDDRYFLLLKTLADLKVDYSNFNELMSKFGSYEDVEKLECDY